MGDYDADAGLAFVCRRLDRVEVALMDIASSLKTLVAVEVMLQETKANLDRIAERLADCEGRIRNIELDMPGLIEIRRWFVAGLLAVLSVLGVAILKHVIPGS